MRLLMTIPTYWSRPEGWRPSDTVFDHPTPLDKDGTLGRALESLKHLDHADFELVIIAVPTATDIGTQVERKVESIVQAAGVTVPTWILGPSFVDRLHDHVISRNRQDLVHLISAAGYPEVRNLSLIAGVVSNAAAVVLVDDDEVLDDGAFLAKVKKSLEAGAKGLAGYYKNQAGAYLLPEPHHEWERRLGKVEAMNLAFAQSIGTQPRIKAAPFAFGGNMAVTRELYRRVPFDPRITRGEDIDYVINAAIHGHQVMLDNELAIVHLPPPHSAPAWHQLKQDMVRFVYERAKVQQYGLQIERFDPYPGTFLRDDLERRFADALDELAEHYDRSGESSQALATREVRNLLNHLSYPDVRARYAEVCSQWCELMELLTVSPPDRVFDVSRQPM